MVYIIYVYINFCTDLVIPVKIFKVYANDKPWVSTGKKKLALSKKLF